MNDATRRDVMITLMPALIQERPRDILEINPRATIPEFRRALVNRVRHRMGAAALDKDNMVSGNLACTEEPPDPPEPGDYPEDEYKYWDEDKGQWLPVVGRCCRFLPGGCQAVAGFCWFCR